MMQAPHSLSLHRNRNKSVVSYMFSNRGLTILELIIVVFLISVIGVAVANLSGNVFYFNRYFSNSISIGDRAQKLLRPMAHEIRSASQSNNGSYAIDTMQTTDFAFYSDSDNDGLQEKIRYYLSGTNLMKEVIKPTGNPLTYNSANKVTTTLVTSVRNTTNGNAPVFNYYDSSYSGGASGEVLPSSGNVTGVRLVRITLYLDVDTNMPPPVQVVSMLVAVRNLKQQL